MELSLLRLKQIAVVYLCLPLFVFFLGWLRPFLSVPVCGAAAFCLYREIFRAGNDGQSLFLSKKTFFMLAAGVLLWGFCAGHAGFFYQSEDYQMRNAVFRDLILYSWPVRYHTDAMMVYYCGHWMIPALIAKVLYLLSGNESAAWIAGNILLWLWSGIGVFLTFLFLIDFTKAAGAKAVAVCFAVFVFFSGMDVIGAVLWRGGLSWHLEWWSFMYQYSSMTTCLFWVFNQTIAPWLICAMILQKPDVGDFGFLGTVCLFFAPFPFVGLLPFLFTYAAVFVLREKGSLLKRIKPFFTERNLVFMAGVLPVCVFYFSMTGAVNAATGTIYWRASEWPAFFSPLSLCLLASFMMLEYGFLALISAPFYKKDPFFITAVVWLTFIPFFKIGPSGDFMMRASIPALFVLATLTIKALLSKTSGDLKLMKAGLVICLCIGAITPAIEFTRAFVFTARAGIENAVADDIRSLEPLIGDPGSVNFSRTNSSGTFFGRYLARKN